MVRLAFLMALLLACPSGRAQQISGADPTVIEGTVANETTGEPIGGALVRVPLDGGHVMRSGADGRFRFSFSPGSYSGITSITAIKPGYLATNKALETVGRTNVRIVPGTIQAVVKLRPEGIIYGQILGEGGDPVEGLTVELMTWNAQTGKRDRQSLKHVVTDDEGRFRFAELFPGHYYVMSEVEGYTSDFFSKSPQLKEGYNVAFYPGVPELSEASALEVRPGTRLEIKMRLAREPRYRVSGTLSGARSSDKSEVAAFCPGDIIGDESFNRSTGYFSIWPVPGDSCVILGYDQDPNSDREYFAYMFMKLTSDVEGLHLVLRPSSEVLAEVRKENTRNRTTLEQATAAEPATGIEFYWLNDNIDGPVESGNPIDRDDAHQIIKSLVPGRYKVVISPPSGYYVHSAKSGAVNLLDEEFTVAEGIAPTPLEIVLRDDGGNLTVRATRDGAGSAATILMFLEGSKNVIRVEAADANFKDLAPGSYRVLAIDSDVEAEYESAAFLQKYAGQGQQVTLEPNQSTALSVELARPRE